MIYEKEINEWFFFLLGVAKMMYGFLSANIIVDSYRLKFFFFVRCVKGEILELYKNFNGCCIKDGGKTYSGFQKPKKLIF
jgi:hypothetical protein